MIFDKKKYEVKHYFVLARIVKKDGSPTKKFDTHDFLDKDEAQNFLNRIQSGEIKKRATTLPYQIIEYTALQQKRYWQGLDNKWCEEFLTIYIAPKCVRENYDKNAQLKSDVVDFKVARALAEQKAARFGKLDCFDRPYKKKATQTRTKLVHHLVLLSTLLDYADKGMTINFESKSDKMMYDELVYTYAKPLIARGYPFVEMFLALTKKALNLQNSDETIILELSQIVLFGANYGETSFAYENHNLIREFFFGHSFIELSPLIYAFNREMIANKKTYRQKLYKQMGEYQKKNKEKINKYQRDKTKRKQKKSSNDTTTTNNETTSQQGVSSA